MKMSRIFSLSLIISMAISPLPISAMYGQPPMASDALSASEARYLEEIREAEGDEDRDMLTPSETRYLEEIQETENDDPTMSQD